ncbi:MAG: DUF2992 family protein [Eggerthellaceae bacterium]|nr:DUF2992 family protein [Eggerthellaceae bacterium]
MFCSSTKTRQALSAKREKSALRRKADARERRDDGKRAQFELRPQKRKAKHRSK